MHKIAPMMLFLGGVLLKGCFQCFPQEPNTFILFFFVLWRGKSSPGIPVRWEGCAGGERHRWAGICSSLSSAF